MYEIINKSVFNAPSQFIVNTVNTKGVMGAGLALEFKLRYPKMFDDYKLKCKENKISTEQVDYYIDDHNKTYIVNFSTKQHWRYPSVLKWIEDGLQDFVKTYQEKDVRSIAFPKLGCDRGGLDWKHVEPMMKQYLGQLEIDIFVCLDSAPPEGVEIEMIKYLQNMPYVEFKNLSLQDEVIHRIHLNKYTIKRFRDLLNMIDKTSTYEKIFSHIYSNITAQSGIQLSLF
jgi:O-acetyl-ADP-ribose deacetylase (regulator of RNase III)